MMALLAYNRKKQFLSADVEGLIKQLTGFQEDDKNFEEVAKFVYSNLIHHNFATVDISSVQQSIEGITEKFKIHSLGQRGKRFQELVDKYISSDFSHHTQLNVQWYVLLLLLKLAYKPTSLSEEELKVEDQLGPGVPKDEINWAEYLREGWEEFHCQSDDSENDEELWLTSEDEEVEEPAAGSQLLHMQQVHTSPTPSLGVIPHPSLWGVQPPSLTRQEVLRRLTRETTQLEQWFRSNVQNSWWSDASCKSVSESKYPSANMCEIWEKFTATKYVRDSSPLFQTQVVSEFKVLHEVLWMLQVSTETGLFQLDNDGLFCVKANLSLPSTIPDTLRLVLEDLCPYFNMINTLRQFEENISEQELSENPPPVTYKAYCAALFQQLHKFNKLIINIETKVNKQEETLTLSSVVEELTPGLNLLQYLYDIHSRAVVDWHSHPAWLCSTRLLSVLYEALLQASDQMYVEASLHIFIHSFHVYLDIIDVWLSEGRLEDWRGEFLVIKQDGNLEVMPYESEMRKYGVTPVSLLSKLVTVVRDAGRTMEVVSQLNKLSELRNTVQNKGCLFKEFSENIYNEIKRLKENIRQEPAVSEHSPPIPSVGDQLVELKDEKDILEDVEVNSESLELECRSLLSEKHKGDLYNTFPNQGDGAGVEVPSCLLALSNKAMYDRVMASLMGSPLLNEALHEYLQPGTPVSEQQSHSVSLPCQRAEQSVSVVGLMSMHSMLEKQLELVVTRHKTASQLVTQTLRKEYSLLEHFTVLRTVFFMECGNLAQGFYSYLFKEIELGTWNNTLSLSVQLQMCVEEFYPGFGNCFSVLIGNGTATENVHQAIPAISLAYRVDWPVSTVVTPDTIDSYNKVFRFLLHLKYAFWTLHNIRFSDLNHSPNILRVRRLQVLKLWMYHSTNTLHTYFMGLVLRSFSTHLEESIRLADSMDVIKQAHNKFLDEVKVHCLQDKKTHVETFIMKLLRLCSTLADRWQMEAAGTLTDEHLHTLEEHYMTSYRGLVHCLEVVTAELDSEDFLCELKNEFSHSVPEPCYVEST